MKGISDQLKELNGKVIASIDGVNKEKLKITTKCGCEFLFCSSDNCKKEIELSGLYIYGDDVLGAVVLSSELAAVERESLEEWFNLVFKVRTSGGDILIELNSESVEDVVFCRVS